MEVDDITGHIVDAAVKLHMRLGPGLLESVYEKLLARELLRRGLVVERQKVVTFDIDDVHFTEGLRLDILVNGTVAVEIKSLEKLAPIHSKQLLTYLRVLDLRAGLLINFGGMTLKEGLHRIVNNYSPPRPSAHPVSAVPPRFSA